MSIYLKQKGSTEPDLVANGGAISNQSIVDLIYPIGSIYETKDPNFNPNIVWGGTWSKIEGKQLIAANGTTYIVGNTYGNTTHNHTTGDVTLTTAQLPSHTHIQNAHFHWVTSRMSSSGTDSGSGFQITNRAGSTGSNNYWVEIGGTNNAGYQNNQSVGALRTTATNQNTGGGQSHNHGSTSSISNLFTSIAIIIWERTN